MLERAVGVGAQLSSYMIPQCSWVLSKKIVQTKNKRQMKFTKPIQLKIATFFNFLQRSFSAEASGAGRGDGSLAAIASAAAGKIGTEPIAGEEPNRCLGF